MRYLNTFCGFLRESQDFDTKLVDKISDLNIGDEVFRLGEWKTVDKIEGHSVLLYDPVSRTYDSITQSDLNRLGVLVKINPANESVQAEFGQPGVPKYTHITLPETNQRIEGPVKTEPAVRRLLQKVVAEQSRVRSEYRNSQEEAQNEAGNVLFNYTDELKGLGWMII